jgi:hypothetical protein
MSLALALSAGFAFSEADDDLYKLTTKGQNLLADRGVGVNES